jgi:hypothetical protein
MPPFFDLLFLNGSAETVKNRFLSVSADPLKKSKVVERGGREMGERDAWGMADFQLPFDLSGGKPLGWAIVAYLGSRRILAAGAGIL